MGTTARADGCRLLAEEPVVTPRAPYRINLTKKQAPPYVTYPYVLTGYRCGGSYARCVVALLEWHTETLNAWTMIAGVALSVALLAYTLTAFTLTWRSALPCLLLTASTVIHLPFTVGFHLFRGISPQVYNLWRRLDQVFIFLVSVLLAAATSWYVLPAWGTATLLLAASAIAAFASAKIWSLPPGVQRNRGHVVGLVACIVLCYYAPMGAQAVSDLVSGRGATVAARAAAAALASLVGGAWVFARGVPERWLPYAFDLVGSSHQLMHVAAVAAHVCEYVFLWDMLRRHVPGNEGVQLPGAGTLLAQLAATVAATRGGVAVARGGMGGGAAGEGAGAGGDGGLSSLLAALVTHESY